MRSKDRTFTSTGFCFVKYATSEEADRAIAALHNQHTLPGVRKCVFHTTCTIHNSLLFIIDLFTHIRILTFGLSQALAPLQVRYADGDRERQGNFSSPPLLLCP